MEPFKVKGKKGLYILKKGTLKKFKPGMQKEKIWEKEKKAVKRHISNLSAVQQYRFPF